MSVSTDRGMSPFDSRHLGTASRHLAEQVLNLWPYVPEPMRADLLYAVFDYIDAAILDYKRDLEEMGCWDSSEGGGD